MKFVIIMNKFIIKLTATLSLSFYLSVLGEIRMAFVLYKHLGSYLSTENASMKFSSETLNTNYSVIVNSPIITAAINKDSNKVYLSDPVIFTVRHIQVRGLYDMQFVLCSL